MVQRVVLRLLQALTDSELQNTVIGVLTACRDLDVTVPSGLIERNSDSPSVHVPAVIRGRTATELLVDCNVTGISSRKLVAVNYVTLLNHANLDCLLQLAKKVQVRSTSGPFYRVIVRILAIPSYLYHCIGLSIISFVPTFVCMMYTHFSIQVRQHVSTLSKVSVVMTGPHATTDSKSHDRWDRT